MVILFYFYYNAICSRRFGITFYIWNRLNLPFFIARRYLLKQKGTFSAFIIRLAIIATALSVGVMIIAMATVNGFKHTIKEKMYSMTGHIHIELFDANHSSALNYAPIKWDAHLANEVRQLQHVTQVTPFAEKPAIVRVQGQMEGLKLKGVSSDHKFPNTIQFTGGKIDYSDSLYAKQIILSRTTADRIKVNTGDTIQLIFPDQEHNTVRIRKLVVVGLYHTGVEEIDRYYGLCDIRLIQNISGWTKDDVNGYQVELDNAKYADTVSSIIFNKYLNAPLTSYTAAEIHQNIFDWLDLIDMNGHIILSIMAIVAIINLGAALMILIVDQSRLVGMMKALGMEPGQLRKVFLYYSGLIAGAGIILGNIFGVGLCLIQMKTGIIQLPEDTYYMKHAPIYFNWAEVAAIDVVTLLLCILCMWLPTLYIRYIQPAKVLQFK